MADRKWYAHPVAGGIIGVFAGGVAILLLESAGHAIFGTADPGVPESITTPMFLSVLIAWTVGCFVAGTVATIWSGSASILPGVISGLVLLGGAVMNLVALPHPIWLVIATFLFMPSTAWAAARLRVARKS